MTYHEVVNISSVNIFHRPSVYSHCLVTPWLGLKISTHELVVAAICPIIFNFAGFIFILFSKIIFIFNLLQGLHSSTIQIKPYIFDLFVYGNLSNRAGHIF